MNFVKTKANKSKFLFAKFKKARYRKNFFFQHSRTFCKKKRWDYFSKRFKNNLIARNLANSFFDGVASNSSFKKGLYLKSATSVLYYNYIKPIFRLDVLLWKLNFFTSPYEARISILKKKVTLNDDYKSFAYIVKGGDVINISDDVNIQKNYSNKLLLFFFNSWVEVDYFSKTVVVLQDFTNLTTSSIPNLIRFPLSLYKHLNYLRKI